jgi:4-amino-4-deoxy-L-arabinose transferase-like glycosyltransferase
VGRVDSIAAANVADRLTGSRDHQLVVQIRLALTGLLWVLALLGWLRRRRHGQDDTAFALLAVVPFLLLGLQSYGGELLLRVYLFGLPFMAFLAAALFLPVKAEAASWRKVGAIGLAGLTLLGGFLFARYGNERFDHFTSAELAAVHHLYAIAPPGSLLLAATSDLPWKFQGYARYEYRTVPNLPNSGNGDLVKPVLEIMRQHRRQGAYLIITRSQRADTEARNILPPGSLDHLEQTLRRSTTVRLIYTNQDAQIYTLRPGRVR